MSIESDQEFKNKLIVNPLTVLLLLMPSTLLASGYGNPIIFFSTSLIIGSIVSSMMYLIIGTILVAFGNLKSFMMVPVFLVIMSAVALTLFELVMLQVMNGFPGGIIIGALICTTGFIYLVKNSKDSEDDITIE